MNRIGYVAFRGNGESAGVPAYTKGTTEVPAPQCPPQQPNCDTVNFRGRDNNDNNGGKWAVGIIATLALAAGGVIGLAYAHNTKAISKLSDGKFKDFVKKAEPAAEKCSEWCNTIKTKSVELWNKIKDKLGKKGN